MSEKKLTFRDLRKDEIECRVAQIKETGLSLLLYKNARCDMNILDETVGAERWQRDHFECKGNLFCKIGVLFDNIGWVWKADCGTESNTEKQKGEASDSFKRAGFNWGIGRELYTAPFIWIAPNQCKIEEKTIQGKKKKVCYDNFIVKDITIKDKKIIYLRIYNQTLNKDCFAFTESNSSPNFQNAQNEPSQDSQIEYVLEADVKQLVKMLKEHNIAQKTICEQYQVKSLRGLTMEQYEVICNSLVE